MSFVKVNRDVFKTIFMFSSFFLCFASGIMFPVGGLLLAFDDFPLVKNILSPPQQLFGIYSIQKLQ